MDSASEMRVLYAQDTIDVAQLGWATSEDQYEYGMIAVGMEIDIEELMDVKMSVIRPYRLEVTRQSTDYNDSTHGDGYADIVLKYPPTGLSAKVRMVEPTVRMLMGVNLDNPTYNPALFNMLRVSRVTRIPVETLKNLRLGDFMILLETLEDFLGELPSGLTQQMRS